MITKDTLRARYNFYLQHPGKPLSPGEIAFYLEALGKPEELPKELADFITGSEKMNKDKIERQEQALAEAEKALAISKKEKAAADTARQEAETARQRAESLANELEAAKVITESELEKERGYRLELQKGETQSKIAWMAAIGVLVLCVFPMIVFIWNPVEKILDIFSDLALITIGNFSGLLLAFFGFKQFLQQTQAGQVKAGMAPGQPQAEYPE